jgi:uncharacterized membrane protein
MPEPICMKLGTRAMILEPKWKACSINPSNLYVCTFNVARQGEFGKVYTRIGWIIVGCIIFYAIPIISQQTFLGCLTTDTSAGICLMTCLTDSNVFFLIVIFSS